MRGTKEHSVTPLAFMPQRGAHSSTVSLRAGLPQAVYCNTHTNDLDKIPMVIPVWGCNARGPVHRVLRIYSKSIYFRRSYSYSQTREHRWNAPWSGSNIPLKLHSFKPNNICQVSGKRRARNKVVSTTSAITAADEEELRNITVSLALKKTVRIIQHDKITRMLSFK